MKKFESKRNGQIAELVSQTEEQVTMRFEDGEEKSFSPATLKRWWVEIEEPQANEEQIAEIVKELVQEEQSLRTEIPSLAEEIMEEEQEEVEEEPAEEIQEEKEEKEEPKEKPKKKKAQYAEGILALKEFIEKWAIAKGSEIGTTKLASYRSLRYDGKGYMSFLFTRKRITLWMKSQAVEGVLNYEKMNHSFDATYKISEDTPENRELIIKALEASLNFQIERQKKKIK